MILLKIVMVSPGTRFVKIMSPSPEPMSPSGLLVPVKKKLSPKLKMLGPLCNRQTPNSVLQFTEIKI